MRKNKIQLKSKESIEELKKALKRCSDDSQKTRIRAIIALRQEDSITHTATTFSITRKTLYDWID